jgi:hypothetical protein
MFRVRITLSVFAYAAISAGLVLLSLPAYGVLGGDANSVQSDEVHLRGTLKSTLANGYIVHEIKGANDVVVREYVSNPGKVFGVAWQGPLPPDLRQLLGSYFDEFAQAAQSQNYSLKGRRPMVIELPGLVVESGGHMRAFAGRAYVPELIPSGVRAEVVQ